MRESVTSELTSEVSFSVCAIALSIHFCLPVSISSTLRARGNDGDGCFQFVARVGDELLLLLRAANHWVDGPAREQHDKQEDEQDARRVGEQRPDEHHAHRTQLVVAVEEDGDILAVIRLRDEKSDNC